MVKIVARRKRVLFGMRPVFRDDGKRDGAVAVAISADGLEKAIAADKLSRRAVVAIVDPDEQTAMSRGPLELPPFDALPPADQAFETRSSDGKHWLYAFAPLYGKELSIVYAMPRDALMTDVIREAWMTLILPIAALMLTSLAIWVGAQRLIIRWLDKLHLVAAQVAFGQYRGEPGAFAKAPREIAELNAELSIMSEAIEKRNAELLAALDAKTALTSEIHHRVKNNLQIVSSLLNLQAKRITDPAARDALSQTRARIGALAQIHRLLYEEVNDGDIVDLSQLLVEHCKQLRLLHAHQTNVTLVCASEKLLVPASQAVPLSLFAVEAITNGYRHAFPEQRAGVITINSGMSEGQGFLRISDDGVGFESKNDFSSMGYQLMSAFADQLSGQFTVAKGDTGGSVINLTFPIAERS